MQKTRTVSTNKIIIFIVFACTAIITSVFIFHMSHQPTQPSMSSNDGIIFSAARDMKPFELVSANTNKFSQKDFLNHWTLLFFGFTHCSNVCPATLDMMNKAYDKLHASYPNLQVVLISLDPQRDSPEALANYTHSFNPDFIGVSGKIQELRKLQSQLGIFSARDASTPEGDYQLQHTSSILLINPQGKWAGVFKYGMNPEKFAKAFLESVKSLSH